MSNPMKRDELAAFSTACWNKEGGAVGHMDSVSAAEWAWHECAAQHREVMEDLLSLNAELLEALEEAAGDLFLQIEPKHGAKAASQYPSFVKARAAIAKARSQS